LATESSFLGPVVTCRDLSLSVVTRHFRFDCQSSIHSPLTQSPTPPFAANGSGVVHEIGVFPFAVDTVPDVELVVDAGRPDEVSQ
jgi:hypothetical protein